jgi:hypothetical protein
VIALLQKPGYEAILKANLENNTNGGFMPLQQALASDNPGIALKVIELLQKSGYEAILKANLQNNTNDGFIPLQQALASNSEKNVAMVIALSEQHLPLEKWQELLMSHNNQLYNQLHSAAMTNDFQLFMRVIQAINKAFPDTSKKVITKLANEKTKKEILPNSRKDPEIEHFLSGYRQNLSLSTHSYNPPPARGRRYTPGYNNNSYRGRGRSTTSTSSSTSNQYPTEGVRSRKPGD